MTKTIRRSPRAAGVLVGIAAVCVVALLALAGCGDSGADLPDGVVARVGDAAITEVQLTTTIDQSRAEAQVQGQTLPKAGDEGYDAVRQQALQSLVQQKVVEFEARECGTPCAVTKAEIAAELDRIKSMNFEDSQKKFDKFLKDRGITRADARVIVQNQLQQQTLFEHHTRGVRFTAAEARAYYDANPGEFTTAAGRTARHILVETEADADRVRAEVTLGNFAQLAKANSTDTGSAEQGGSIGPIQEGQLVPEFEKVAFALKAGEISQPVKTQFGWHIITVEITPTKTTSFAEARAQIMSSQLAQKRQTTFTQWSETVLKKWEDETVYSDDSLKPETATAPTAPTTTAPAAP